MFLSRCSAGSADALFGEVEPVIDIAGVKWRIAQSVMRRLMCAHMGARMCEGGVEQLVEALGGRPTCTSTCPGAATCVPSSVVRLVTCAGRPPVVRAPHPPYE